MSEQDWPYPGTLFAAPPSERQREANSEAHRVAWRAGHPVEPALMKRSPADLRNAVLQRMGAWPEGEVIGDAEAMALLEAFEARLRAAWEEGERGFVRQQAEAAVRRALEALADGKLL